MNQPGRLGSTSHPAESGLEESMQVKLFTQGGRWKSSTQVADLEAQVNSWLKTHPDIAIEHVHQLSHPNFGWTQLAVAVWYRGEGTATTG
jgi:hypothetical protein